MKYIIFDLEWNQAPDASSIIQEPIYLTGEIVEIGAVKLDENFCPMDELRLSPHCCRHTYVSQMQALGVDLATIQSIVGHADIDMTKHYLHVQESIRQAAIEKFSEAFTVEEEQMRNSSHLSLVKSS